MQIYPFIQHSPKLNQVKMKVLNEAKFWSQPFSSGVREDAMFLQ